MYQSNSLERPIYDIDIKVIWHFMDFYMKSNKTNNLTILNLLNVKFDFTEQEKYMLDLYNNNKTILSKLLGLLNKDEVILAVYASKFIIDNYIHIDIIKYTNINLDTIKMLLNESCKNIELHKDEEERTFYKKLICKNIETISSKLLKFIDILFSPKLTKYGNVVRLMMAYKTKINEMWYTVNYKK
jgi:hypothetical protein